MSKKPLCIIIRDGWGKGKPEPSNAIYVANTPWADKYEAEYPTTTLTTSGEDVGLPAGTMGNSEVGHLNIGAGRVVYQSLTRIDKSIRDGEFFNNESILKAIETAKSRKSKLHLMGLIQEEGVHAVTRHCHAILETCKRQGFSDVVIHAFTDGRDTPPKSALGHMEFLQQGLDRIGIGKIGVVIGRYYAMDRDKRWERTQLAYDAIIKGVGTKIGSWKEAIEQSYAAGANDEFIKPFLLGDYAGAGSEDVMIFFNFRTDRVRQLTQAIIDPAFDGFPVVKNNIFFVAMTHYYDNANFLEVFPEMKNLDIFGEILSKAGLKQLRCAETEKFAHVTFFFNDQNNDKYPGEDHILVNSPKVATYDLQPEMSAFEVRDKLVEAIASDKYDVIITNFANCDMVGHTGFFDAIITAVQTVDTCVHDVVEAATAKGGVCMIFADHGNADQTQLSDGSPMTAHTMNVVPFTIVGAGAVKLRDNGSLCDVAPTALKLLGISQPAAMTGKSLIV